MYNLARFSQEEHRNRAQSIHNASYLVILRIIDNLHVEPLEALLDGDPRARATARPDPAQDRFQPNPVLIGGPQLDGGLRVGLLDGFHLLRKFFLKASWAAGSALAWRGRSTRLL